MKNIFFKTLALITLIAGVSGCTANVASGNWENVLKDESGATITTTLLINEVMDEFNGALTTRVDGNNADSLKLPVKDFDFSGYISGKVLVINQVKKTNDPYFRNTTLTVSEDGKTMLLSPGGLVFNKK